MEMSLADFIHKVKDELRSAQTSGEGAHFYELKEVELEVAFSLATEAQGGVKLVVFGIGAKASEVATHRVRLSLDPLPMVPPGPGPDDFDLLKRLKVALDRDLVEETDVVFGQPILSEDTIEILRKLKESEVNPGPRFLSPGQAQQSSRS